MVIAPLPARAADIGSSGPLTQIHVSDRLQCQVHYEGDSHGEFYGGTPASCGTFLGVGGPSDEGGVVYGGSSGLVPVSQSAVTGHGTGALPYRVETIAKAGETGLSIKQIDTYVAGADRYTTTASVTNSTSATQTVVLYHAADCYLGDSDYGYGHHDDATGGIFCTKNANNSPPGRLQGFIPVEGGSNHVETHYSSNWSHVFSGRPLPDTCDCSTHQDNGMAISWTMTLQAGATMSRSWATDFSPVGAIKVKNYAALGDSVAAGEGIGYGWTWDGAARRWTGGSRDGTWSSDFQSADCHQTPSAHPRLVANAIGAELSHFACTGASTFNGVLKAKRNAANAVVQPAQLGSASIVNADAVNSAYDDSAPDVVSLSLGANDVQFADLVARCYGFDVIGLAQCGLDPDEERNLINTIFVAKSSVRRVLQEIVRRGEAHGKIPVVALTQYVDPFPASYPTSGSCIDINPRIGNVPLGFQVEDTPVGSQMSNYEMGYLRTNLRRLNAALSEVAQEFPNVVVIPPPAEFAQHRWCSSDPWVYGASTRAVSFPHHLNDLAPFHPTAAGQAAIAEGVVSRIRAGRQVTLGTRVPTTFPNSVSLVFDRVLTGGAAFFSTLRGLSPARRSGTRRGDTTGGLAIPAGLPMPEGFAPVAFFSVGTSAEHEAGVEVSLPHEGAAALYQAVAGGWERLDATIQDDLITARVDRLSPLALGDPAPAIDAAFSVGGDGGVAPAEMTFEASGTSSATAALRWDFGDGETATGAAVTHRYRSSGSYDVVMRATSPQGAVAEATRTVTVKNAAPEVHVVAPDRALTGVAQTFSAEGSRDPNGEIASVAWSFGDGSPLATGPRATHAFDRAGEYTVTATVYDEEGAATERALRVRVVDTVEGAQVPSHPTELPPPTGAASAVDAPAAAADTRPPRVRVGRISVSRLRGRGRRARASVRVALVASDDITPRPALRSRCRVGGAQFKPCKMRGGRVELTLARGTHALEVEVTDAARNRSVVRAKIRVPAKRRAKSRPARAR